MACSDSKPKREFKSTTLKKLNDIFQGFVDSLEEEILTFNSVLDVAVNRDHRRELTHRLKIVENLVKSITEKVPHIQENLTVCDEILRLACDNPTSQEVMDNTFWRKLPREVVQHVGSFLPHEDSFGILMADKAFGSFRIAVTNSKHSEWFHLELKDVIPAYRIPRWSDSNKNLFAHDGVLISIMPCSFDCFEEMYEPPSIFIFNPLTGDKKIPLSSFCSSRDSNDNYDTEAVLLQLIVDSNTGCYQLVLVTQKGRYNEGVGEVDRSEIYDSESEGVGEVYRSEVCDSESKGVGEVYRSEIYDSESELWSTLDSGFIFGVGVINDWRCDVYFDCCSKQLCRSDGEPVEDQDDALLVTPRSFTFVKNHGFEIGFIDPSYNEAYRSLEMSESVWENDWIMRSTRRFLMAEPPNGVITRVFASQHYVLVVADDAPSMVFEHRHQRMVLFDRETRKAAYDFPNFWRRYDTLRGGPFFMERNLHVMYDLKWIDVP